LRGTLKRPRLDSKTRHFRMNARSHPGIAFKLNESE